MLSINLWVMLIGTVAVIGIGYLWYSPFLFGKQWIRLSNWTEVEMAENNTAKNMRKVMVVQTITALIEVYTVAYFISLIRIVTISQGLEFAFWVWFGFMVPILVNEILWDKKNIKLFFINSLYYLVSLSVVTIISILLL